MGYYDDIAEGYDELHGEEQLEKAKIILGKLKIKKPDKLLDVGCGTGLYLDMFNCHATGVDPSLELIKQYRGRQKIMVGKAEELGFMDDYFDIVMSITAIHNFEDIRKGMSEMKRVGKKTFVFSILKRSPKFSMIEKLIKEMFVIDETVDEEKDTIFFCRKE
jgi:demethylmenaquinone methyltransferase / 2-methoxy-6-polyprenyl-1,4-benzoquinol methylase